MGLVVSYLNAVRRTAVHVGGARLDTVSLTVRTSCRGTGDQEDLNSDCGWSGKDACLTLNKKALPSCKSLVTIYQSTWRNITEDLRLYEYRCEKLKSRKVLLGYYASLSGRSAQTFRGNVSVPS